MFVTVLVLGHLGLAPGRLSPGLTTQQAIHFVYPLLHRLLGLQLLFVIAKCTAKFVHGVASMGVPLYIPEPSNNLFVPTALIACHERGVDLVLPTRGENHVIGKFTSSNPQ